MATFIRLMRESERKEILLNTENISKIEVQYAVPSKKSGDTMLHGVTLHEGATNPESIRLFKVFFGTETYLLRSLPNDPVVRVIQEIYDHAIRSPDSYEHALPDIST